MFLQCVGFVDFLTYMKLLLHGFHFHRSSLKRFFALFPFRFQTLFAKHRSPAKHITYWHRPHTSSTQLPVVFIHGIGIGLYPYTNFLSELNSNTGVERSDLNEQVGIIAIEIMPVSFRITHSALRKAEMCEEIDQILHKHLGPDQKFVLVSHSYGTVVSTHLLKSPHIAQRIGPIVLIDPVSILLHLPDVAYNFTRRKPKEANEHQLYYFASMDMGVSHTLSRHFFWNENVLWKKNMAGRKVTVSLSGQDLIVNTEAVGRYLTRDSKSGLENGAANGQVPGLLIDVEDQQQEFQQSNMRLRGGEGTEMEEYDEGDEEWKYREWRGTGIDVLWFKDLDHAQVFDKRSSRQRLINAIREYCKEG
jgi:pimeloyl-ACP methyl ester carboxylesterase